MSVKVEYSFGKLTNKKQAHPAPPPISLAQGIALRESGQQEQAIICFQGVLALDADNAAVHGNLGLALSDLGRFEEARDHYHKAVTLKPDYGEAWRGLANTGAFDPADPQLATMDAVFNAPQTTAEDRIHLGFALAKVYEEHHRYEDAFSCLEQANRLKRDSISFDLSKAVAMVNGLIDAFDRPLFERHAGSGHSDTTPIFVLGMPRSGTSLVEQILASHPSVHGAGERPYVEAALNHVFKKSGTRFPGGLMEAGPDLFGALADDYLARLRAHDATAPHIVDKMLGNFMLIGLIHLMAPKARIIHVHRDPVDNCFSIYSRLFAKTHLYAYDLEELATFYGLYRALMDHWRAVLPGCMMDFSYEALIANPERETRALLAYCDLPFDAACLSPHQTSRAVLTASNFQVRQPINNASVARWRHFETHLRPLQQSLSAFPSEPPRD